MLLTSYYSSVQNASACVIQRGRDREDENKRPYLQLSWGWVTEISTHLSLLLLLISNKRDRNLGCGSMFPLTLVMSCNSHGTFSTEIFQFSNCNSIFFNFKCTVGTSSPSTLFYPPPNPTQFSNQLELMQLIGKVHQA